VQLKLANQGLYLDSFRRA